MTTQYPTKPNAPHELSVFYGLDGNVHWVHLPDNHLATLRKRGSSKSVFATEEYVFANDLRQFITYFKEWWEAKVFAAMHNTGHKKITITYRGNGQPIVIPPSQMRGIFGILVDDNYFDHEFPTTQLHREL